MGTYSEDMTVGRCHVTSWKLIGTYLENMMVDFTIQITRAHCLESCFVEDGVVIWFIGLAAGSDAGIAKVETSSEDQHLRVPRVRLVFETIWG